MESYDKTELPERIIKTKKVKNAIIFLGLTFFKKCLNLTDKLSFLISSVKVDFIWYRRINL